MIEIICLGVAFATWIVSGYFYSKWEGKRIDASPVKPVATIAEPVRLRIAEMAEVGDC